MLSLYRRILRANSYHLIERIYVLAHTKRTGDRFAFNMQINARA